MIPKDNTVLASGTGFVVAPVTLSNEYSLPCFPTDLYSEEEPVRSNVVFPLVNDALNTPPELENVPVPENSVS